MEGLLEPEIREEVLGHLEVRQVFSSGKNGIVVRRFGYRWEASTQ